MRSIYIIALIIISQITIAQTIDSIENNGLKASKSILNFAVFTEKQTSNDSLMLINRSNKTISFYVKSIPENIKCSFASKYIYVGDSALLIFKVSGQKRTKYGPNSDRIVINTSDSINPKLVIYANYCILDDFSGIDSIGMINKPSLSIHDSIINVGSLKQLKEKRIEIKVKNPGLSELIIRRVKPSLGMTNSRYNPSVIKAGQEVSLNFYLNTGKEIGAFIKKITIISNDPIKPIMTITVKGKIEN